MNNNLENETKTFYYPQNLSAQTLIMNMWNFRDVGIFGGLLVFNVILILLAHVFIWFSLPIIYCVLSAKIANGYSLTKLAVLYCRFLITDKLMFKWR